jgi:uncharacterized membrane protein
MWIEGIFAPLFIGAMIHVLSNLKQGRPARYPEAMAVGFRNWGRLFAARFVAGLLIVLGLVALIVPGIILAVRYALLDPVVVLEGASTSEARSRSVALTLGARWQIFCAGILFFVGFFVLTFVVYFPVGLFPALDSMATGVALDCLLDVAFAVIQIVLFLYYWEAVEIERVGTEAAAS